MRQLPDLQIETEAMSCGRDYRGADLFAEMNSCARMWKRCICGSDFWVSLIATAPMVALDQVSTAAVVAPILTLTAAHSAAWV